MVEPGNGWGRYEQMVLRRLDGLDKSVQELRDEIHELQREEITELKVEIAMLKIKSGLWGAAAGLIPAALVALTMLMAGRI